MKQHLLKNSSLHLLLIGVLGLLVYSNTFNVPFIFDDARYIVDNPAVQDFNYFLNPSEVSELDIVPELKHAFRTRILGHLTFALNYKLNGLDVTGYHVVNFIIHLLNSLLVYWLVVFTLRTPYCSNQEVQEGSLDIQRYSAFIALFAALLFISHPIQTQAITYITQRFASLVAFFYLLAVVAYVKSRLSTSTASRNVAYGIALLATILAMLTKENAFTLPSVIALCELLFITGRLKKRIIGLLPFFLTMVIIPLSLLAASDTADISGLGESMEKLAIAYDVSRWEYLITQFRVIVTYLRLLVLPINQNLYYDYSVSRSFFDPAVILAFLFLLSLASLGIYSFYHSIDKNSKYRTSLRLIAFGLSWFFITLAMESSIIPIKDVIFEHRVYLPSVGIFVAFLVSFLLALHRLKFAADSLNKITTAVLLVVVGLFSVTAYARNHVWGNEIRLWEDVVRKSPAMAYNHVELALAYEKYDRIDDAIREYNKAIVLDPVYANHYNLGILYEKQGRTDEAIREYLTAIRRYPDHYKAHNNLGVIYENQGRLNEAAEKYATAIQYEQDYAIAHYNLGKLLDKMGRIDQAVREYMLTIEIDPDHFEAHNNLAIAYSRKGLPEKAISELLIAARINPNSASVRNNLGILYGKLGRTDEAVREFLEVIRIHPDFVGAHYNLGITYKLQNRMDEALREFQIVVTLNPDHAGARRNIQLLMGGMQ